MLKVLAALAGFAGASYALDVMAKSSKYGRAARLAGQQCGKPVLNVGSGTPGSSLRSMLFGPTRYGDVNCDLNEEPGWRLEDGSWIGQCDILDLPFADKQFGAAVATHVVEHVDDPEAAMAELHRVADHVFALTPHWSAPHTWLHPGHKFYRDKRGCFRRIRR